MKDFENLNIIYNGVVFSKEILVDLLNSSFKWDIIDTLILSNQEHYNAINDIYKDVCILYNINYIKFSLPYMSKFCFHLLFTIFSLQSLIQLHGIVFDDDFANFEYTRYLKYSPKKEPFDTWRESIHKIYNELNFNTLFFIEIFSSLHLFRSGLFKPDAFYHSFSEKIADYILLQYQLGNLDPSFLEYMSSLIT